MLDDELRRLLDKAPDVTATVDELFELARRKCEERYFVTIVDVVRMNHEGQPYLICGCGDEYHFMVQQYAEFFSEVKAISPCDFVDPKALNFVRRLHILAYSQFWECLAIKRLISSLVYIANGKEYQPRLWLDGNPKTYHIFENTIKYASKCGLRISELLSVLYNNKIRNAFAHCDFWFVLDYISFSYYLAARPGDTISIHFSTWDQFFEFASKFIQTLFNKRVEALTELEQISPYRVSLPEFLSPFDLYKNEQGYWVADSTRK